MSGWAYYHRHVVASRAYRYVDNYVFHQLWRMLRRRHPEKSKKWLFKRYWTATRQNHVFCVKIKHKGKLRLYQLLRVFSIGICRHVKVKAQANPYLPKYAAYFWHRRHTRQVKLALTWGRC